MLVQLPGSVWLLGVVLGLPATTLAPFVMNLDSGLSLIVRGLIAFGPFGMVVVPSVTYGLWQFGRYMKGWC